MKKIISVSNKLEPRSIVVLSNSERALRNGSRVKSEEFDQLVMGRGVRCTWPENGGIMTKKEIIKELRSILKDYHYKSDTEHMSKDVVTSLENLLGSLLKH